jgi:DNA mismatch repair protein MutS
MGGNGILSPPPSCHMEEVDVEDLTPALRQYLQIKEQYPDCILFFRMGDFYEMFLDDAHTASPVLEIALTTRDRNKENPVPMCGVPYHAADIYISKLLKKGYKVAVCEQMEDPSQTKGLIRREVVRVLTPGLVSDATQLSEKEPHYIAAFVKLGEVWGAAFLDFSTGLFKTTELNGLAELADEIYAADPKEVVLSENSRTEMDNEELRAALGEALVNWVDPAIFEANAAKRAISEILGLAQVDGLGLEDHEAATTAVGALLRYVSDYQKGEISHLSFPRLYVPSQYMVLDEVTKRNLELSKTIYTGGRRGSLLSLIDRTVTSMGGRLIREWLNYPLTDIREIRTRHDSVAELYEKYEICEPLREMLGTVVDLERLIGRISVKSAGPRDLVGLSDSLKTIPRVRKVLKEFNSQAITRIENGFDDFSSLTERIDTILVDSPGLSIREGGFIRDGVDNDLDELRELSRKGKDWIIELEGKERRRTGIGTLKVRFNRVFGYYIEVTNSYLSMVPADYIRKQTLVGAERFITPDLKEYEAKVLGAEDRMRVIEYAIFSSLRDEVKAWITAIKKASGLLATLDVLTSLALIARDYGYTKPVITDRSRIDIIEGRHPMVEKSLPSGSFVPNDVIVDGDNRQILIITGPNMAGKSTIIRQAAIIVLMAQMGSFVPAREATIGVVDRIFARVGASDSLVKGQSTFMVEMVETANILNNATAKSLVILDEIGRGTGTFDGISIAWAVAEFIHDAPQNRPLTLFATHYHELTELSALKERVKNYHVAVREWNGRIIFIRKLEEGISSHSYGIEVAKLAGIPSGVLARAREILKNLEKGEFTSQGIPALAEHEGVQVAGTKKQLDLFAGQKDEIITEIKSLDIESMTPLDAMKKLYELKEKIKKIGPV